MQVPIYVLNLTRDVDRRRHMEVQLQRQGLQAEFVTAIDGHDAVSAARVNDAARHAPAIIGRSLTAAELGCLETHLLVLARIASGSAARACVLEDDVALGAEVPAVLHALARIATPELVLLGHHSRSRPARQGAYGTYRRRILTRAHVLTEAVELAVGAYAYVVTPRAAAVLLQAGRPARMPFDWVTGHAAAVGLSPWLVTPPCVVPAALPSSIGVRDPVPTAPPVPAPSPWWEVARAGLRTCRRLGIAPRSYARRY